MTRLGPSTRVRYEREGFLSPVRAIPAAEMVHHAEALAALETSRGGRIPPILNAKIHLLVPYLWDLVHDPRLLDPVEDLLGPDLLCWGSSFFAKAPGTTHNVPWHQDGTYWGLCEPRALTLWLAFTQSDRGNGCMRVLPRSHESVMPHEVRHAQGSMLPVGEEVAVDVNEDDAVDCILAPGEMSLHHVLIVHGSNPNRSIDRRRVGFAVRYVAGDVRQREGRDGSATLVRGRDHGTFCLEAAPEGDFHPAALRRHRDVIRRASEVVTREAASVETRG